MNYRHLLKKYIEHVGVSEGTTFLSDHAREEWPDSVKFTDEEWAELQKIEAEEETADHSCSCHARNQGPCRVCKTLGCEVWDFNQVNSNKGE